MKIRTRLTLSFAVITVLVVAGMMVVADLGINKLVEQDLKTANEAIEEITTENHRLSEEVLTRYGEKLVENAARRAATRLSFFLRGQGDLSYARLRRLQRLREIATQDIYAEYPVKHKAGYIDLLDNTGTSVLHPNRDVEGKNFSEWKEKYPEMWGYVVRSFTEEEVKGYYTFIDEENRERKKYMVLRQVEGTPFIVAAVVNIDDYFLPVHDRIRERGRETIEKTEAKIEESAGRFSREVKKKGLYFGVVILVLGSLFGWWIAARISRPVLQLRDGVRKLGKGDFSVTVSGGGMDEVAELKEAFNRLGAELKEYMENLKREVSARQAVESEIKIARRIQESLLPRSFPPFPDRGEFDLFAVNLAAKEVAGDFYDFFMLDDDRIALVIADVSGKGVPAALFMAVTRTLLKNICVRQPDPARALFEANNALCEDNENSMFVTLILGSYNLATGTFEFANAGHDELLILKPDGTIRPFGLLEDIALGVLPDHKYAKSDAALEVGDALVFYTDGVTEALSPARELFGRERLEKILKEKAGRPAEEICRRIREAVMDFQEGGQFDDVTVMVLRREK